MADVVLGFLVAVMFILGIAAVGVVFIMAYDLWKESEIKKDLDARKQNGDYAEAVKIVRCKDCEFWTCHDGKRFCEILDRVIMDPDFYCECGLKKEE